MGVRYTLHFWTLALVILPGVLGDNWGVWYSKTEICAVRESTETIRCRYTYPELTVNTNPPGRIKEGDNVNLTCDTTCKLNQSEITLLKNKQDLGLPSLQFNSISYQNSGNYSCALKGNITISSKQMILDVQYPPKSTSVSVSPSGEIVEGSSVTLTCSSDANPRVQSYTWFKENRAVSSKRLKETYTISNMSSEDSGRYHCQAQNEHGVDNSTAVALTVAAKHSAQLIIALALGIILIVLVVAVMTIVYFKRRKSEGQSGDPGGIKQAEEEGVSYASIQFKKKPAKRKSEGQSGDPGGIKQAEEEGVNYASIQFKKKPAKSSAQQQEQPMDDSNIYSTLKN
ncbi:B-cell receptor CD22-like isoform X2 [Conger conger]|uniref:B-cell receptor CD22-like isoform X2 n=1 Tax=Conger conger TaxID=82655 RepID=UPI002A5A7DBD|nr:B-cell receptor CD22-like isoform X2 [Conger conger]